MARTHGTHGPGIHFIRLTRIIICGIGIGIDIGIGIGGGDILLFIVFWQS